MKKFFTIRVWILLFALIFALSAINPSPGASCIEIKQVTEGSAESLAGIQEGQKLLSINHKNINTLADYHSAIASLEVPSINLTLETDQGKFTYETLGDLGFVHQNLTIVSVDPDVPLQRNMHIISVNQERVNSDEDLINFSQILFPNRPLVITTSEKEYAYLSSKPPEFIVEEARKTNIVTGLDLSGGTRVVLKPVTNETITNQQIDDVIAVLSNRLNVYGLSDLSIRPATDITGNKFIIIEIASTTKEEVRELIAKQGKFEAKIGEDIVFVGGKESIPFVCRNDAQCSGILPPCSQVQDQFVCTFQFSITLSEEAAQKHADITKDLPVNTTAGGRFLSKQIDFYLDSKLVDSLNIGEDLKGKPTPNVAISGPGYGSTEAAAYENALKQMNKLQTILISGSLPFKIEIVQLDTISPVLGQGFLKNIIFVMAITFLAVAAIIYIRYRRLRYVAPMLSIMLCELFITLGVASLIRWNLDLASIAGIIAAIGTGVDDQIVIIDEAISGASRSLSWKERIKKAFSVVLAAYCTTVAAMLPLWSVSAGLIRGFAVTTIIGVTIGVLITRPAFGSIIESIGEKE